MITEKQMQHGTDWTHHDMSGWIMSEKFDGCRAYWDGERLWSRGGMSPEIPAEWKANLPKMHLDCELYDGIGGLSRCGSALRYGKFTDTMVLKVFDAPHESGDYLTRLAVAESALSGLSFASVVDTTICVDNAHAVAYMQSIQARGGEGAMCRNPSTPYAKGRSNQILKVKRVPFNHYTEIPS